MTPLRTQVTMKKLDVEKQVINNPHNVVDELLDQISNNKDL